MKEQEAEGDLPAIAAAMQIIGASYVETLDTKGTDGSNVHLGGPATITGYFGGIGQPNDHPLLWLDEFLHYYTEYGVRQVLNINPGTVLAGYLLHRLGVDIEFKISVFMGNDNPYAGLWTLIGAKLFARDDGTSPLVGFNWGNSVNNETLEITAEIRRALGFEDVVRFEHHITETCKSIVLQPYDRRDELVELADHVPNISAKHEGGDPEVDGARAHPSDILDYFRAESEVIESGDWENLQLNFLDKLDADEPHGAGPDGARPELRGGAPTCTADGTAAAVRPASDRAAVARHCGRRRSCRPAGRPATGVGCRRPVERPGRAGARAPRDGGRRMGPDPIRSIAAERGLSAFARAHVGPAHRSRSSSWPDATGACRWRRSATRRRRPASTTCWSTGTSPTWTPAAWRLRVDGLVRRAAGADARRTCAPARQRTLRVTMECAGNGRRGSTRDR